MAAPTLSVRGTPTGGVKLRDGYSSKISFAANLTVVFWEKDVTPPGLDGGEPIDQTTMFNTVYEQFWPQTLQKVTNVKTKVAYSPVAYQTGQVASLINVNGSITVQFPDGATATFYGYLKSFIPSTMVKGGQPEAEVDVVVTNTDPATYLEQGPVIVSPVGT